MSFANTSITDIIATTIQNRTRKIADNVTNNNALLKKLSMKGKQKPFSGGNVIMQELSFQENSNAGYYSGYDILPVGVSDVISAAEFQIKQAAVPVIISGLEQLQNTGKEQMIDLMEGRLSVAESTMSNLISTGLYSDGTGSSGKEIGGLQYLVQDDPTSAGDVGGIPQQTWAFWRNATQNTAVGFANLLADMNTLWASLVRGGDRPDLVIGDSAFWTAYVGLLQAQQRFTGTDSGEFGFPTVKFMDADVCLDGGIYFPSRASGGAGSGSGAYFLNCDYLHYRPHSQRNMVPLSPNRRYAVNQDAEVQILAWAGNLTTSGRRMQGRLTVS